MLYSNNKNKHPDECFAEFIVKLYKQELEQLKKSDEKNEINLLNKKRLEISIEALINHFELD